MIYLTNRQQELIKQITEQIVMMIKEEGIEEFEKHIIAALQRYSEDYTITCMTREEIHKCENTNRSKNLPLMI